MSDLTRLLERADRALEDVPLPDEGLEGVRGRRDRKRRNQRFAAGSLGMALFVAAIWITTSLGALDPGTQTPGGVSAGPRAKTRVTFRVVDGGIGWRIVGGIVQSTRPFKCAEDRRVAVYRQEGPGQEPRTDDRITSVRASLRGDRYAWRTGHLVPYQAGRLYAHVSRTGTCRADTSRTIHVRIAG